MNTRKLAIGLLVVLACSCESEDAGIVLNIDADVTADRTAISRIAVTVGAKKQEWTLTRPLPGSLGIQTSPGSKAVKVEGFVANVLRGQWSGTVVATRGSVVVQDVHLALVGTSPSDAGVDARDGSVDVIPDAKDGGVDVNADTRDGNVDVRADARDSTLGEVSGTGGISGKGGTGGRVTLPPIDGGTGGGTGGIARTGGSSGGGTGGRGGSTGGRGGSTGWDGGDAAGPVDVPDGSSPDVDTAPPIVALFTGAFSVSSQFEVLATAAAPGPVGDTLGLVHDFVEAPGAAIIGFADDAGVPGLSTLRSVLPDVLESRLTVWMDSYIKSASAAGVTPYDELIWLDNTVQALLLHWGLDSRLDLPFGRPGTHAPLALTFGSPTGSPFSIPLDPTAPVTTGIGVTAVVSWPDGTTGSAITTISDHFMGLPFGRYALQALNAILLAEYGAPNITKFLSNAIGCPGMAAYVASRCVDIVVDTVCVGHEGDLLDVCEGGLAEGANQIENQILSLDLKMIHLQQGAATAIGAQVSRPQDATALQNGVWIATVDFGNGPEAANATFSAVAATVLP